MKIMLVDDDIDEHEIFIQQLAEFDNNIKVISAYNGHEALKMISEINPDYIFLDINMPKLNGLQVLKTLKEDDRLKEIPVCIYSTSDGYNSKNPAMKLGASYYFEKPTDADELQHVFNIVLGNAG